MERFDAFLSTMDTLERNRIKNKKIDFLIFFMIFHDFSSKKIAGRPFKSSSGPEILEIFKSFDKKCSISALRRSWELILGMISHNSSPTSRLECARMLLETSRACFGSSYYFFPKMKTRGIRPIEIL